MDGISALYNLTNGFNTNPTDSDLFWANTASSLQDGTMFDGLGKFVGGYTGNAPADDFMKVQRKALEDMLRLYSGFAQGMLDSQGQYSKDNALADAAKISEGYKTSALAAFQNAIPKFANMQASSGSYSNTAVQNLANEFAASSAAKLAAEQAKLTADLITQYRRLQNEAFNAAKAPPIVGNPASPTRNESAGGDLFGSILDKGLTALVGKLLPF